MKTFKCFVRGENFPGDVTGLSCLVGFYTTRYVRANHISEIEPIIWQSILNDARLSPSLSRCNLSDIKIILEDIERISEDAFDQESQGFVWYEMDTEN